MVAILLGIFLIFFIQACTRGLGTEFSPPHDGDVLKQLLESLIMTSQRRHQVTCIELPVPWATIDTFWSNWRTKTTLPDLSYAGYIQAPAKIAQDGLLPWLDAKWGRANGKLVSHDPYRNGFLAPDPATAAAFVYIRLLGELAQGKGGRPAKAHTACCGSAERELLAATLTVAGGGRERFESVEALILAAQPLAKFSAGFCGSRTNVAHTRFQHQHFHTWVLEKFWSQSHSIVVIILTAYAQHNYN